jgi:hypothetical protein
MCPEELGWEILEGFNLVQDRYQWRVIVDQKMRIIDELCNYELLKNDADLWS